MSDAKPAIPKLRLHNQLSFRLLRWVLVASLAAAALFSLAQIALDASRATQAMDDHAAQLLAVIKEPATQAAFNLDLELARQVVDGLFEQRAVRHATIRHPDQTPLAERSRPLATPAYRQLTDVIFGNERQYLAPLARGSQGEDIADIGHLVLVLDTAEAAGAFLERAALLFLSDILKAFVLGLIVYGLYHYFLTAPLMSIISSITEIDPAAPGRKKINIPLHHGRDELGLWVRSANNLLQSIDDNQQQRQAAEAQILKMSQYELLTGLPNRAMFRNQLQLMLNDARRTQQKAALMCVGIDDFKSVNDQYGYSVGDRLLRAFAERLVGHGQSVHAVSRLSGDRFALIQDGIADAYQAASLAEDLVASLNQPFHIGRHQIHLLSTIGIAVFPDDEETPDRIVQKAEQTMMLAKTSSRGQFQFYIASVDIELRERRQLEKDLGRALANHEFYLVYQPQINMVTGEVIGAEALLRWNHPTRGLVPPDIFIPIAESSDTIKEIGAWVLRDACRQLRIWRDQGLDINVSVNLSAVQLRQRDLVSILEQALKEFQIEPNQLELEITETSFMESLHEAVATLNEIRRFGVRCAVDDFGTGYSSLSYLKQLPIDKLKIDKQFVRDLLIDEDDTSIVNAIIQLGRSLKLNVIAEGVETAEQAAYLTANGCIEAQGYFYSKPLSPDDFLQYYQRHAACPI